MVALLALGALLWLRTDPTREQFPEYERSDGSLAGLAAFCRLRYSGQDVDNVRVARQPSLARMSGERRPMTRQPWLSV
jgi:hypothetical protein